MTFGDFIEPCESAQDIAALNQRLRSHIGCGDHAASASGPLLGQNRTFDRIAAKLETIDLDQ